MEVLRAIKVRYSCRDYLKKPVPEAFLTDILEAGRLAPSARNTQPWKFLVVKGEKREDVLKVQPMFNSWMKSAPAFIVVVSDKSGNFSERFHMVDLGIAVENMLLRATELGLGTCVCGGADWKKLTKALKLGKGLTAVLVVTVGYPSGKKPLAFRIAEKTGIYKHDRKPLKGISEVLD